MKFRKLIAVFAAVAVSGGLALATAAPASATTDAPSISTSHSQSCGKVTITLRNQSPWIYPVSVEIDGVHSYGPTVDNRGEGPDDQTETREITFPEDSGVHTVKYRVDAGTEADLYLGKAVGGWKELTVQTDCVQLYCPDFQVITFSDEVPWGAVTPATEAECPSPTQAPHDDQRLIEFEVDCDAGVTARYEVWTTSYTFDRVAKVFVASEPVLKDSWTVEREATAEEIAENCPDTQEPEALVVTGEWADGEIQCDDTEVEQTREVTTTGYILDGEGRNWVLDTENAETVTETQTRELTEAETEPCPVPAATTVTPTSAGLADTGFDGVSLYAAIAAITLGAAFAALGVIRRHSVSAK